MNKLPNNFPCKCGHLVADHGTDGLKKNYISLVLRDKDHSYHPLEWYLKREKDFVPGCCWTIGCQKLGIRCYDFEGDNLKYLERNTTLCPYLETFKG